MLEQVESKIKEFDSQHKSEYTARKEEDLTAWGFRKSKKSKTVVTDEEYEAMVAAANKTSSAGSSNKTAKLMNFCSVFVAAFGIVAGIILSIMSENLGFMFFSILAFASVLLALMFRGIGEAIRLLQQLLDMKKLEGAKENRGRQSEKREFPEQQPNTAGQINTPPVVQGFDSSFNF